MKIVCTNNSGESLTVEYSFPFVFVSCGGLMNYTADVKTVEAYLTGDIYQGLHSTKRNLVLQFALKGTDYWGMRERIYTVFGLPGTFYWYPDAGDERHINYYVESIEISDPNSRGFRFCTVSLICPYPYFSGEEKTIQMSYWTPLFRLPFTMQSPFKVGERVAEQIVNIQNPQPINVGMNIYFTATGNVTNPKIQNLTTGESFQLAAQLYRGDVILVSTVDGEKWAGYLNDPQQANIWNWSSNDWVQLYTGDNMIRYDANTGLNYLDVKITYNQLYLGG